MYSLRIHKIGLRICVHNFLSDLVTACNTIQLNISTNSSLQVTHAYLPLCTCGASEAVAETDEPRLYNSASTVDDQQQNYHGNAKHNKVPDSSHDAVSNQLSFIMITKALKFQLQTEHTRRCNAKVKCYFPKE